MTYDKKFDTYKFSYEDKNKICSNNSIVEKVQKYFERLSFGNASSILRAILIFKNNVNVKNLNIKTKVLIDRNKKRIDGNGVIESDVLNDIKKDLCFMIPVLCGITFEEDEEDLLDNDGNYILSPKDSYNKILKIIHDNRSTEYIKYPFENSKQKISNPLDNDNVQRCNIRILKKGFLFNYPHKFVYDCPNCGSTYNKYAYEVLGTNDRLKCGGRISHTDTDGNMRSRLCGATLIPNESKNIVTNGYYYDISYVDDFYETISASLISLKQIPIGNYEAAIIRIPHCRKTNQFLLLDYVSHTTNRFEIPKKNDKENYIFTLINSCDAFIKKQTNMSLWGFYPIKACLICQKIANALDLSKDLNIKIMGDKGTFKTTTMKYYGILLNQLLFKKTNGKSLSVPALRGTINKVLILGKEQRILDIGELGRMTLIHIDEISDNIKLAENLKTFLLEPDYSYDMSGSNGTVYKRIANVNIVGNIDTEHYGQYIGYIKKRYNGSLTLLKKYANSSLSDIPESLSDLRNIISDARHMYLDNKKNWIDGMESALCDRFLFSFFLYKQKTNEDLKSVIFDNATSDKKHNIGDIEILSFLRNDNIKSFIHDLEKYKISKDDNRKVVERIYSIMNEYGIPTDARFVDFYMLVCKLSRIINQRYKFEEMDFDFVRYIIEYTNKWIDVSDTDVVNPSKDIKKFITTQSELPKKEITKEDKEMGEFSDSILNFECSGDTLGLPEDFE